MSFTDASGPPGQLSDEELMRRAQRGDREAFARLHSRYQVRLFPLVVVLLSDKARAEDCLQNAWTAIWTGRHRFDLERPFKPWLYSIVIRHTRKEYGALSRWISRLGGLLQGLNSPEGSSGSLESLLTVEDDGRWSSDHHRDLMRALASLTPLQREAVLLVYQSGLTNQEAAEVLGISAGTFGKRLFDAVSALRTYMNQDGKRK